MAELAVTDQPKPVTLKDLLGQFFIIGAVSDGGGIVA